MALWPFSRGTLLPDHDALDEPPDKPKGRGKGGEKDSSRDDTTSMAATWATLLEPFSKGQQLPAQARTEPHVPQKEEEPMTIAKLWQYLPFLAVQGTSLTKAFVNHHLYGPPKPSWGVELTLFSAFLREVAAYSHLSSLARLRSVLELGSLLPTPKDGIVTPVSFRVKRRGLRGFLADADAQENGKRLITGEWVINKRLWRRMQTEFAMKKTVPQDGRVILYLHGGAYYMMSTETHRFLTISCSRFTESRVFAINYRLAPETRFPGQLHDAVSAYFRLINDLKIPADNIVFAGDSAGGGLCLALMMYLRDEGYPLPSGAILMSPWVDLTMSCESWSTNRPFDYLPSPKTDDPLNPVKCLLGSDINQYLTHPYVSPLFGDFHGLPPLLIQAGDAEVLRDEITLLAHKASLAGVAVEHEIFEDCVHVFQAFLFLEASRKAFQSQRYFVKHTLPSLLKPKTIDFGEIDADIAADAHLVDQRGNAESTTLPSTPISTDMDLPIMDSSDSEVLSDSTSRDSPVPASPPTSPSGKPRSRWAPLPPARTHHTPRPILRAYASARDLAMSPRKPTVDLPPPASPSSSIETITANGSASATPTRHRRHTRASSSAAISFTAREEANPRPLHARSSSHPDFRALLEDYATAGPSNSTKVYGATASGRATPVEARDGFEPNDEDKEQQAVGEGDSADATEDEAIVEMLGKRKTGGGRARAPSFGASSAPGVVAA